MEKYICDTCNKSFDASHLLKNHIRLSHVGKTRTVREPMQIEKEEKEKVIPVAETTEPIEPIEKPQALTPDENALFDQISRSKMDWEQITEDDLNDFSLSEDPMKLPPEAARKQELREYAFHWAAENSKRIAQLTGAAAPDKWWVVNRTTAPWLPSKYFDPTVGAIRKKGCILMMRPWKLHQLVKNAKLKLANALYESRDISKGAAERVASHDDQGHVKVVTGDRAAIRGGDTVFNGEASSDGIGELVSATES